jgi:hypothetical protein
MKLFRDLLNKNEVLYQVQQALSNIIDIERVMAKIATEKLAQELYINCKTL